MGMYLDIPFDGTCKTCMFCKPFDTSKVYCERHPEAIIEDPSIRQLFCPAKSINLTNYDTEFKTTDFIIDNGKIEFTHLVSKYDKDDPNATEGPEMDAFIYDHKRAMQNCQYIGKDNMGHRMIGIGNTYLLSIIEWIKSYNIDINPYVYLVRHCQSNSFYGISDDEVIKNSDGIFFHANLYRDNVLIRNDWSYSFSDNNVCYRNEDPNDTLSIVRSSDFSKPMYYRNYNLKVKGE